MRWTVFYLSLLMLAGWTAVAPAAISPDQAFFLSCGKTLAQAASELRKIFSLEQERTLLPYRSFFVNLDDGNVVETVRASHPTAREFFAVFPLLYPILTAEIPNTMEGILPLTRDSVAFGPPILGTLDESKRELSEPERKAAELLLLEGWSLAALPEGRVHGLRSGEGMATLGHGNEQMNIPVEIKSPDPGADHNTIKNEINNSLRSGGQAPYILIDARGTGLTAEDAIRGMRRMVGVLRSQGRESDGKVYEVRIAAETYDYTWHFTSRQLTNSRIDDLLKFLQNNSIVDDDLELFDL